MPFKILKKSRQYNVMSKDLYVISVSCLDGSNIDCTLSSDSKGLECLENVCQRAGINQSEFFGLKYFPKGCNDESEMRWVDLDRPLNRQLEKHASNTKTLHLRIMYYVISGISLITDEQTRNYYFLQLKQDIVEGRISCDAKQAIILANYSRQAEYGNYQDRHKSVDYLKSFLSFPKHLIEEGMLEVLTEKVIEHEHEVHDVNQSAAEEFYISLCQQLDGYGQETFMARNEDGMEVLLGISVSGVIVSNSGSHKFYPWREIVNVVNHKRNFSIECTDQTQNVNFTLKDSETGRYIWKCCVNQHTFFMNYEQNHASQVNLSLFQNIPEHFNESREDLLASDDKIYYSNSHLAIPNSNSTNLTISTNNMYVPSTESLHHPNPMDSRTSLQTSSILDINNPHHPLNNAMLGSSSQWNPAGSNTSLVNRAQSSSCVDLTNSNANINIINNNHLTSAVSKERFLPKYRPAPAYELAILQKYKGSQPDLADMEYYLHKQHRNHSLNALNLSNSQMHMSSSEPIYENVPLPQTNSTSNINNNNSTINVAASAALTTTAINSERNSSNEPVRPRPRNIHTEPSSTKTNSNSSMVNANAYNNSGSNKNISDPLNNHENAKQQQQHYLFANNDNNSNSKISGSASMQNISLQERDVNHISVAASSSPFHIENLQMKQKQQVSNTSTTLMNTSGTSSNYTFNTTTTADTTDSGVSSTEMGNKKESKRNKFWNLLGKNKSSSSSNKQKSATLGRDKEKSKKDKSHEINKEIESNMRHRWSTGLPRLPLPANISKEKLCQLLDAKLNDSQLFLEFERIPKRKEYAQYTCALMEENRNKNLDPTCLPMDENRVKLIPTRENRMGYVNASHITNTVGQKQRFYIAAQSPSNMMTANFFWQCVWEADVYLLIQLTDEFIYVPPNSDRCCEYGQYQVWREFSQETNKITTSKLRIYHTQSRRYRSVWHVSCYEFNEQQHCPTDISQFLKFLEELNSVRLASISEVPAGHNSNPPVLIHCNNGERTGLTLVADLLLYTLDHNQDLDIPRVIGQLREQRDKIIPSLIQYKFIYALLIHYLRQTRLI